MLVQYEEDRPPPLVSTWSSQDTKGSSVLIFLAWLGLLVGACGALYWAHLSVLGAIYGTVDWPGYVWLAVTAAGAALIAPVMYPFLETRRPEISRFVLIVGIISWIITSVSGTLYLVVKSQYHPATLETLETGVIEAKLAKDTKSVYEAQNDCRWGIWRGCEWLNGSGAQQAETRIRKYDAELWRRKGLGPPPPKTIDDLIRLLRKRFLLFMTVTLGGSIALAMVWGPAEALKAMYSEPGTLFPKMGTTAEGLPRPGVGLLENPVNMAFESGARQGLERARGERAMLATMHAHYRGWCIQRGLPTFASDEAFGRALNRSRDPMNPNDLGGPMLRFGAFPHKTGGRMEYIGVRILPDTVLDDIEGGDNA